MSRKKLQNLLYWVMIAGLLAFILYQKGIIGTDFESITPKEAYALLEDDTNDSYVLIDVRTREEYAQEGHIENALLIPLDTIETRIATLGSLRSSRLLIYCRSGNRSMQASRKLNDAGFHVINISGGITQWKQEDLPIQ